MVFDLNNQAEPQMVLKTDALSLNNSEFNPWIIKRFRGDIGRASAYSARDREFESHLGRLTIFFFYPNFF